MRWLARWICAAWRVGPMHATWVLQYEDAERGDAHKGWTA
jgi:hypothetical protein